MFSEWPRPAHLDLDISFPLNSRRGGRSSYCREANEIPFGRNSTPKGSWSHVRRFRHTNEACLKCLSLFLPFPPPFPPTSGRVSYSNIQHTAAVPCFTFLFKRHEAYAIEGRGMICHASATRLQSIRESLFLVPCGYKSSVDPAALGDSR